MSSDAMQRLTVALSDRDTIARALGAGGMATVYLAQDRTHDRQVAIKVLKPELADALDYAHRHGVMHRDIMPENILLHVLMTPGAGALRFWRYEPIPAIRSKRHAAA